MDQNASGALRPVAGRAHRHWPVWALTAGLVMSEALNDWRLRCAPPDDRQRIAAILISWSLDPQTDGVRPDEGEIARWVAQLKSPNGEERVRAAWWLGARGIRSAGPVMATAMRDSGTRRLCQLAHELGKLGDDQWVPLLLDSAGQTANTDLQVCAMLALGELASQRATDGLIDLYRHEVTATAALAALGEIADSRAAPFLRAVVGNPRNDDEHRLAVQALARIEIMAQSDPVPALVDFTTGGAGSRSLDVWAVRHLVALGDGRAVPALVRALAREDLSKDNRLVLAAALTAFGVEGEKALQDTALPASVQPIANAALGFFSPSQRLESASSNSARTTEPPAPAGRKS